MSSFWRTHPLKKYWRFFKKAIVYRLCSSLYYEIEKEEHRYKLDQYHPKEWVDVFIPKSYIIYDQIKKVWDELIDASE